MKLSYDVASRSEITPCDKIDKPLAVYSFTGGYDVHNNVADIMTKYNVFMPEMKFQSICHMINRI